MALVEINDQYHKLLKIRAIHEEKTLYELVDNILDKYFTEKDKDG